MSKNDLIFKLRRIRSRQVPVFKRVEDANKFWRSKTIEAVDTLLDFVDNDQVREILAAMQIDEECGDIVGSLNL